eukprot:6474764-Amphidinium_carterae.2
MRLGCRLAVADSMHVNDSQVECIVATQPQAAESDRSRRLSVEVVNWNPLFLIEVPDAESAAIIEQHVQNYSKDPTEFAAALKGRLLATVQNPNAIRNSYEFGQVSVDASRDTMEVQVLMWISNLLGATRCAEEPEFVVVGSMGNATVRCFGRHDQEVADGVACQVGREGDYSVSVPTTIFNETGKDDYVLVVINLNTLLAESFADVTLSCIQCGLSDEYCSGGRAWDDFRAPRESHQHQL